jgi:hypothetical protein
MDNIINKIENLSIRNNSKAGGENTNKNGLLFEKNTSLEQYYTNVKDKKIDKIIYKTISLNDSDIRLISFKHRNFHKYMINKNYTNKDLLRLHGSKNPDECYLNKKQKIIFIIEKKYQSIGGSVCEKLQTAPAKIWNYENLYTNYKIIYLYCLSQWFFENCKCELQYLDECNIKYFNGDDKDYKLNIIKYILSFFINLLLKLQLFLMLDSLNLLLDVPQSLQFYIP